MNLPPHEWFFLPGGFLLFPFRACSIDRVMGDLQKADWSSGVTGKEKSVNAIS
jgi:hypothetical protein